MKLTKAQRAAFFAGKWPKLAGEGVPPVKAGYVHKLSSRLSFEVVRVHLRRGRWRLEYRVVDDREERYYLMPGGVSFACGPDGKLLPMPPEEEIGYTRNPRRKKLDRVPSVPPKVQHVIEMRAKLHDAQYDQAERADRVAEQRGKQLTRKLRRLQVEAAQCGVDIAPALISMIQEAEREIAQKRVA